MDCLLRDACQGSTTIAASPHLNLDVLFSQGGRGGPYVADGNGRNRQALDNTAVCADEVRMLGQVVLCSSGLEAPDMVAKVRSARKTDPDDIQQIPVECGSIPGVV